MSEYRNIKAREYYLSLLGMTGEIFSLRASRHAPTAQTTAGDELRRMMGDGLIRYYIHPDRKRTFRICDPAGFSAIGDMDDDLLEHAEMLVGKKDGRYSGSRSYRLKKRREASLMLMLADAGFIVDGMRLTRDREIQKVSPSLVSAEKIIGNAPPGTPLFLSGSLLRQRDRELLSKRREMSTSTGTIFSDGGIYTTFSINTARFRWYAASETASASDITRLYEDVLDIPRRSDGRFRAVFYIETPDIAADLIRLTGSREYHMNPTAVFRLSYVVPASDAELAADVTRMLTIPDWRRRTNAVLGLTSPSRRCDGKTEDGKNIYNLLCCNLSRINEIEREISEGSCRIVMHDWQKPILEELYATEIDSIALSPKHFRGLLIEVQRSR